VLNAPECEREQIARASEKNRDGKGEEGEGGGGGSCGEGEQGNGFFFIIETTHRGLKCTVRQILPPRYIFDVMPAANENTYTCIYLYTRREGVICIIIFLFLKYTSIVTYI
jgi:hypothetical protein